MHEKKIKVLAVVGPTASGKTRLGVELAKRYNGEIISADSMQIYKQMDIGTAKPTVQEMQGIPHHLIDFVETSTIFNVVDYVKLAKEKINYIISKNKLPIIVGGTGLYVDSLLSGIKFGEGVVDFKLRDELKKIADAKGSMSLLKELEKFDPETAYRLHPNNVVRIIRAIEIYKTTGQTMSEQVKKSRGKERPYDDLIIGLNFKDRSVLYKRINNRVDEMIKGGLIDEAKKILSSNCNKTALNAICYKELNFYIMGVESLESAIERLKTETRKYAKRQLTWFRRNERTKWLIVDEYNSFEEILNKCTKNIDLWKKM